MKLAATLAIIATTTIGASAAFGSYGKDISDTTRDISGFSKIANKGSLDVYVTAGDDYKVRVVADADIIDKVLTERDGETLKIGLEKGNYYNIKRLEVYVSLPKLEALSLEGSGDVAITGVDNDRFALRLQGNGDIDLEDAKIQNLELSLRGSGDIEVSGNCTEMQAKLEGSGDIDANDFVCETVSGSLRGSGDLVLHATEKANLELRGSGDIVLYGRPAKIQEKTNGSGDITIR